MIQKGYCIEPFTAATEACRRRKTREKGRTVTCFTPWSVISCWFHVGKSKGRRNLDWLPREDTDNKIALGCLDPKSSNSALVASGEHNKEASLGLALGFGLIYLMATNKNEINKLADLCKQMETVLQNFKRESRNDQGNDSYTNTSYSTPKAQVYSNHPIDRVSPQDCPSYSWEQENSESDFTSSSYQNSNSKANRKWKNLEMDQLEAELEAELEHLQLQLDDEVMLNCSNQKCSEITIEESAVEESINTSFSEAIERLEMGNKEHQGVHPKELERRLHELQEMRKQETIREVESGLENAMNNIDENQRELSWWKDTARIVFHHNSL